MRIGFLYEPADHPFKSFNAAGLWIFFVKDWGRVFCDSPEDVILCMFFNCFVLAPLSREQQ